MDELHASRRLPGRPVLPHGPQQVDGGRQRQTVFTRRPFGGIYAEYHDKLPPGIRQLRRQSRDALRQHRAKKVSLFF